MDPKTLAGLDPKLRETYEKVMGTASSSPTPQQGTNNAPTPIISSNPIPSPVMSLTTEPEVPAAVIPPPTPAKPEEVKPVDVLSSSIETNAGLSAQPVQPAEMSSLQPSLSGTPMSGNENAAALSKPLQPLPSPASVNQQAAQSGSTSSLLKIVYIIAGIIFFIVYAIFWMKIFNFPLPF